MVSRSALKGRVPRARRREYWGAPLYERVVDEHLVACRMMLAHHRKRRRANSRKRSKNLEYRYPSGSTSQCSSHSTMRLTPGRFNSRASAAGSDNRRMVACLPGRRAVSPGPHPSGRMTGAKPFETILDRAAGDTERAPDFTSADRRIVRTGHGKCSRPIIQFEREALSTTGSRPVGQRQ
jgi:hypothetical protein